MEVIINDNKYRVIINRKNNKNIYIRVKEDCVIYVTCPFLTSDRSIKKLIDKNYDVINKMIEREKKKKEKRNFFYLLGKKYKIIIDNNINKPKLLFDNVYTKNLNDLDKLGRKYANIIFNERLELNYNKFEENIPYPSLIIRKMRRKWGHCNKVENIVTLNLELIKYNIDEIDYVVIHELSHLVHFNHSKEFWYVVSKYKPDYKKNKKVLKEE